MNKQNLDLFYNLQKAALYYQQIMQSLLQDQNIQSLTNHLYSKNVQQMCLDMYQQMVQEPSKLTKVTTKYHEDLQQLILSSMDKFFANTTDQALSATPLDKRFQDQLWQQPYFDFVKQYYLLTSQWMQDSVDQFSLDQESAKYLRFVTQQFIDALSPTNFATTNPAVVKKCLETDLNSLVEGMEKFLKDLSNSKDILSMLTTTDKSAFELGKNIAATPGKVIYQNSLIELIAYEPKDTTHAIPLLIIPPWINKYYVLDLSAKNSLVAWLVENNFQVFMLSWANPDSSYAEVNFADYLQLGVCEAIEQIKNLGYKKVNLAGYCIGGTLAAIAASYFASTNQSVINSLTLITTLLDFKDPGEIGVLINKHSLQFITKEVEAKGYLDGKYIANSFSLIRANDLIWSFFINNYLLGKAPAAFDILYWNADPTNMPAKMYLYYLQNMYIDNKLIQPNQLSMLGQNIDLGKIQVPSFCLAAETDHIALWKSVYDSYKYLGGDKFFCLTKAGHVAGVVNPPSRNKYSHTLGKMQDDCASQEWLLNQAETPGSWWLSWQKWLSKNSDLQKPRINYDKLPSIRPAPGQYITKTI